MTSTITPVHPSTGVVRPLGLEAVTLSGGFWGERQALNATAILPHCHEWVERSGAADNLRAAVSGTLPGTRRGREFADSDVYKLLEAMAWESARRGGDAELDATIKRYGSLLAAAQDDDGYIGTMFGRPGQVARYHDMEWGHELYCIGHLIQAGVARARATGTDDELTEVTRRAADHVCARFAGRDDICGHPEIEMALVELYRVTGEQRYLEQAAAFVERRGHRHLADIEFGRAYFQDDMPVRARRVFTGHAVRELYLACGAVDVAVETGDRVLLEAIADQWERAAAARTYLTGGVGARHEGESYGDDFQLPPDRAYAETCASIALVMLSWRLLLATGAPRYADLIETALFNTIAACPSRSGTAFFYSNPLQVRAAGVTPSPDRPSPRASAGTRAPWFDVSCCPNNFSRLTASLAAYQASVDDRGVQIHQWWPGEIRTPHGARLRVDTGYPWSGDVVVRVEETVDEPWQLSLRVPSWAGRAQLDGEHVPAGYATLERRWRAGDEVRLRLPLESRWIWPDPRIDAVRGSVAVQRGPVVYCAESVDHDDLDRLRIQTDVPLDDEAAPELGSGVIAVRVAASTIDISAQPWPYQSEPQTVTRAAGDVRLIPYHLWANRGPVAMRVFVPVGTLDSVVPVGSLDSVDPVGAAGESDPAGAVNE